MRSQSIYLWIKEWKVERLVDAPELSRASGIPIEKFAGAIFETEPNQGNKIAILHPLNNTHAVSPCDLVLRPCYVRRYPAMANSSTLNYATIRGCRRRRVRMFSALAVTFATRPRLAGVLSTLRIVPAFDPPRRYPHRRFGRHPVALIIPFSRALPWGVDRSRDRGHRRFLGIRPKKGVWTSVRFRSPRIALPRPSRREPSDQTSQSASLIGVR